MQELSELFVQGHYMILNLNFFFLFFFLILIPYIHRCANQLNQIKNRIYASVIIIINNIYAFQLLFYWFDFNCFNSNNKKKINFLICLDQKKNIRKKKIQDASNQTE